MINQRKFQVSEGIIRAARVLIFSVLLCSACRPAPVMKETFLAMGGIDVQIIASGLDSAVLKQAVEQAIEQVDQWESELSLYRPESTVNTISKLPGIPVQVTDSTWETLMVAKKAHSLSKGTFDITIGPLIRLWKQCEKENRLPTDEEITHAKQFLGFQHLEMDESTRAVTLTLGNFQAQEPDDITHPVYSFSIDTGGIAKGLFAEWIHETIINNLSEAEKASLEKLIINVGGDMYCRSFRKNLQCVIGIRDPFCGDLWGELSVSAGAVVTSGTYEREFKINEKSYCHILDPRTGYPVETSLVSVTVSSPEGAMADALATIVFILGEDEGFKLIENEPDAGLLVIRKDGSWKATPELENNLNIYTQ